MSYQSYFSSPEVTVPLLHTERNVIQMEVKLQYINYTGYNVVVVDRTGLNFDIPPSKSKPGKTDFVIRKEYHIHPQSVNALINQCNKVTDTDSNEMKLFKSIVNTSTFTEFDPTGRTKIIAIEYPIPLKVMQQHDGFVYVHEQDVVLGLNKKPGEIYHPFSDSELINSNFNKKNDNFTLEIDIIDNGDSVERLFLRTGKRISTIESRKDNTRKDGIYIRDSTSDVNTFITFDENIVEYGLYRTYLEANTLGDSLIEAEQKKQLMRLDFELKEAKNQLEVRTHQMKTDFIELENRFAREKIQHEKEIYDLERKHQEEIRQLEILDRERKLMEQNRKYAMSDYYEERSYHRKDTNEWLKALPGFIVGIGTAFLTFKSLSK